MYKYNLWNVVFMIIYYRILFFGIVHASPFDFLNYKWEAGMNIMFKKFNNAAFCHRRYVFGMIGIDAGAAFP
jgi:hypothetical protein